MTASAGSAGSAVAATEAAALGLAAVDGAAALALGAAAAADWLAPPPVEGDAVDVHPTTSIVAARMLNVRLRCTGVLLLGSLDHVVGWPLPRTLAAWPLMRTSPSTHASAWVLNRRLRVRPPPSPTDPAERWRPAFRCPDRPRRAGRPSRPGALPRTPTAPQSAPARPGSARGAADRRG